ncbi:hypothetical protein CEXT_313731, partial [Caerostris extrusa]
MTSEKPEIVSELLFSFASNPTLDVFWSRQIRSREVCVRE